MTINTMVKTAHLRHWLCLLHGGVAVDPLAQGLHQRTAGVMHTLVLGSSETCRPQIHCPPPPNSSRAEVADGRDG